LMVSPKKKPQVTNRSEAALIKATPPKA
jgi:hypothetical protein